MLLIVLKDPPSQSPAAVPGILPIELADSATNTRSPGYTACRYWQVGGLIHPLHRARRQGYSKISAADL